MQIQFNKTINGTFSLNDAKNLIIFDRSTFSLLLSNIIVIFLAIYEKWNVSIVLWIYWLQSIIIGIFQFARILSLKDFTTENFKMNDYPLTPSKKTKTFAAFFFAFHYGMFHIVYASFLLFLFTRSLHTGDVFSILLGGFIFFINHLFSYIQNKDIDEKSPQNLGKVFIAPYARILPMHFILIIGATISEATLIIFLILKTLVDLIFHSFKHRPITR